MVVNNPSAKVPASLRPSYSILKGRARLNVLEEHGMSEKLVQGDRFPTVDLSLTDGSTLTLPDQAPGRYFALLFFRGAW